MTNIKIEGGKLGMSECGIFEGPSAQGDWNLVACRTSIWATKVKLSKVAPQLAINGIRLNDEDQKGIIRFSPVY